LLELFVTILLSNIESGHGSPRRCAAAVVCVYVFIQAKMYNNYDIMDGASSGTKQFGHPLKNKKLAPKRPKILFR